MNKFLTRIGIAAALTVVTMASSAKANAAAVLDHVLATKTLKVAVGTDWGPMSSLNDKHELDGYDVEVAKGIANYLGVQAEFITPGWDLIAAGKWEGRWDIGMGQMLPTKERAERFDFPATYFYEQAVGVLHKNSKATKPSDLNGKVVGVAAGTSSESYANQTLTPNWVGAQPIQYLFKAGQIKTYQSSNIALDDLRLGDGVRIDAIVVDRTIADNAIKNGYPVKVLSDPLFSAPGAIAIIRGDKEFSDKIAAAITQMRDNGTLSKLSIKWYGTDHTVQK
ncbi:transporter substrate-binding domain-containing protein [Mesorhizobium sp.]|uniref:transporter substrate-binding domain-containing protein n=1 Tax=Mesorhizobium sp. TaxID=1871066 RepID=UPI000FD5CB64|nr:transporter substrate-binding domain-containing protein [Mesorhizobium sp.]RVC56095.1 transporter substrate-binding domain-containing protein [Mesorhizobium sp. M4B.F.Ca.ET.088.02.2.1]RVD74274.1 transporter substrate-binding domain-containing protein [Mesorhizobium sp. M4A.F.Ca.ET.029.04.2.1]RWF25269.1 MAG: transporter substrate-binding domain-containing protein [Mesorhizobium sp.]RWL02837.1 MAG: transporter substrate-binding domain-containing protein [Mesorhizobium sp.]